MRRIRHYKYITAALAILMGTVMLFAGGALTAFAADSIPVSIMTYENGNFDNAQEVYRGSCSWSGVTDIKEAAAKEFGEQIPDGYTLGVAAVLNQEKDRSIYRVKTIDVAKGTYELADHTSYGFYDGDVLTLYYYPETVTVPVYWCRSDVNGTLTELSDTEYKLLEGNKEKLTSVDVKNNQDTVFAPVSGDAQVTYAIGSDGFFEGGKNDLDKVDSAALFLQNGVYGLSYGAAKTENPVDESKDAGSDSSSEPEYETFSGGSPAIYIICQLEEDPNQAPVTEESDEEENKGTLLPFWIIVGLVLLLLYAAGRRFLF